MEVLRNIVDLEKDKKKKQQINTEENEDVKKKQNEDEKRRKILEEEQNKTRINNINISQFNSDTKEETDETNNNDNNKNDNKKEDNEVEKKTKEEDLKRKDKTSDKKNNDDLNLKLLDKKKEEDGKTPNLINSAFLESGLKHWGVSTEFKDVNSFVDFKASTFHTGSYLQGNFFNNTAPSLTATFGLLKGLHSRHKQISNSITQAIEYARENNISVFESFKHIKINLMSSKKFITFRPTYTQKVFCSKGRKMRNVTVIR